MSSRIEAALSRARARLRRLEPEDVVAAVAGGALVVDIRPAAQRAFEGQLTGGLVIERNVLEWRCDPTSAARLPQARGDDVQWVLVCSQGYTSSLAAAGLHDLGLYRSTDVAGGYQALARRGVLPALSAALAAAVSPGLPGHAVFPSSPWSTPAAAGLPPRR